MEKDFEKERRRIAREIHDSVGHRIALLKLHLQSFLSGNIDHSIVQFIYQTISELDQISDVMHDALYGIRVSSHEPVDPRQALSRVVEAWRTRCPFDIDLKIKLDAPLIPQYVVSILAACASECLANIVKHALTPSKASLILQCNNNGLELSVSDDGRADAGSPPRSSDGDRRVKRFGLLGMHERLAEIGGSIVVKPVAPNGFSVIVVVPVRSA